MKVFYKSTTFWVNLVIVLGGLYLPGIGEELRFFMVTAGLANIGLRFKTKDGIKLKREWYE